MPNIKSAKKRVKTDLVKKERNKAELASMKTAIKKVKVAAKENNKEQAVELLKVANKKIDKAAGNGLIHKNKSARDKSKLAKIVDNIK